MQYLWEFILQLTGDTFGIMNRKSQGKTAKLHVEYGQVLLNGINAKGIERKEAAARAGVEYGVLNQWIGGFKPVPPKYAPILAELTGLKPEQICAAYEPIEQAAKATQMPLGPEDTKPSQSARVKKLEGEVLALWGVVSSLTLAMMSHRPAEARDVLRAVESTLTEKERDFPFLHRILQQLRQNEADK